MWLISSILRQTLSDHLQGPSKLRKRVRLGLPETPAAAPRLSHPEAPGLQLKSLSNAYRNKCLGPKKLKEVVPNTKKSITLKLLFN